MKKREVKKKRPQRDTQIKVCLFPLGKGFRVVKGCLEKEIRRLRV